MKQQNVMNMIKDVRVILEETVNAASLEGVTDVGSISINEVIKGVLTKAVTSVANIAPMELFMQPSHVTYTGNDTTTGIFNFTDYQGCYVKKPTDYLRTLYVQGNTWQRPVTVLTPLSSPFVSIARSTINLSVGNVEKPLAVDSFVGGNGVIELYPASTSFEFVYVERPVITTESAVEKINCDDGIYHASTFYAAYLVAMIKGYQNAGEYKTAALETLTQTPVPTNATAGAPIE